MTRIPLGISGRACERPDFDVFVSCRGKETKGHHFACEADKKRRGEQGVVVLPPTIQGAERVMRRPAGPDFRSVIRVHREQLLDFRLQVLLIDQLSTSVLQSPVRCAHLFAQWESIETSCVWTSHRPTNALCRPLHELQHTLQLLPLHALFPEGGQGPE